MSGFRICLDELVSQRSVGRDIVLIPRSSIRPYPLDLENQPKWAVSVVHGYRKLRTLTFSDL